jgi:hypothetical protein
LGGPAFDTFKNFCEPLGFHGFSLARR